MIPQEFYDRIKDMDMNEKNAFLEKIITALGDIEDFLAHGSSASTIVQEAKNTAAELLRNFQEDLGRREEENISLRRENAELKKKLSETVHLQETVADMADQISKFRHDSEQMLRERDAAKKEAARIQELWNKLISGE
jgi:vacuolar-type H+-ATPase subunit H